MTKLGQGIRCYGMRHVTILINFCMVVIQLILSRDRDNLTKRLNEEHDQRRIEQMEVILYTLYWGLLTPHPLLIIVEHVNIRPIFTQCPIHTINFC